MPGSVYELGFGQSSEQVSPVSLPVKGNLPEWLRGTLIRNGPGAFQVGQERYRHWFDGLAMLHRFNFDDSQVSYTSRFLQVDAYTQAQQQGRIVYSEFATDPQRSFTQRVRSVLSPQTTDNAKVSITRIHGHTLALAETPIQVEFDPETLLTLNRFSYEANRLGQMTTVHPVFDFHRNQAFNLVTRYNRITHYNIHDISDPYHPQQLASIPTSHPAYLHSFGITPNYFIVVEFSLVVNPLALLLWLKPFIENFRWKPGLGSTFWIIDRRDGKVVNRLQGEPFFAFHHVNAFERKDEIVLDIDAYEDASILRSFYLDRLLDAQNELPFGRLRRYRLPLHKNGGGTASYEIISDACMELANFDYARYNMDGSYRYVYASSVNPAQRQGFYNQVLKVDIQERTEQTWYAPNCYPGEPIFVGRPGRKQEDDGVVVTVVLDALGGHSFLLVLDAHNLEEIARAEIPQPVLFGYHGAFFGE
jgi:carotenoid cleavage dioxygenase-like enzyme